MGWLDAKEAHARQEAEQQPAVMCSGGLSVAVSHGHHVGTAGQRRCMGASAAAGARGRQDGLLRCAHRQAGRHCSEQALETGSSGRDSDVIWGRKGA
jgi:hypothetical protein